MKRLLSPEAIDEHSTGVGDSKVPPRPILSPLTDFLNEDSADDAPQHDAPRFIPASQLGASDKSGRSVSRKTLDMLNCPLTGELMRDPVMSLVSLVTYEREALLAHIAQHGTDPSTGEALQAEEVVVSRGVHRIEAGSTVAISGQK